MKAMPSHTTEQINATMKTLFTAEAISKGGCPGTIGTPDGLFNVMLAVDSNGE
jgi:hypothetical protein